MADLTKDEIRALGHAVGLEIEEPELTEVMYSLNALLESLDAINPPGLEDVEPPAHHPPAGIGIGGHMDKSALPFLSASELSRLIESREVSPVEAAEAYLERIDDLDFKFNSYLTVTRELAMTAAKEAEQEIASGNHRGPMHGVPVAVKDQLHSAGVRSTGGSRILADFVPAEDATVIANLKRAGAVLLGKTNLTEFAITGFSHRYSTPRNPWDLDLYAGGSSSGSGAATGAYLCATSLGEDTGGSIRFPATWCGLVGLRPTWGLVSRYGVMRGVWSMDTVGPHIPDG